MKISNAELRSLTGASRSQVQTWEKDGLPFVAVQGRRGRPAHLYERWTALEWVAAHGRGKAGVEAGSILRREVADGRHGEAESPNKGGEEQSEQRPPLEERTMLEGLEAIYKTALRQSARWAEAESEAMDGKRFSDAATAARARGEAAKIAEGAVAAITQHSKEIGKLVDADELAGQLAKAATTVKNNILEIIDPLPQVLLPFLRDADDIGKVREVVEKSIHSALRNIASIKI